MKSDSVFIFGHKNPDTDSVCGAISLSYLKNEMGMNTRPCVLGDINHETKYALDYFGVKQPYHLNDVKLQIKDVSYHKGFFLDKDSSIKDAIDYINNNMLTGIPLVENKNKYFGYVSLKELSREIINGDYHRINTSYDNILKVLNGTKVLKFDKEINGNVLAATFAKTTFVSEVSLNDSSILIVGDRDVILDYAIENSVKLIIVVANLSLSSSIINKAKKYRVNIISTPYTSYEVSKNVSLSNYVKDVARAEGSTTFNEVDYLSDFYDKSKKLKHTNYPIVNNKNECTGLLTLTDCNEVKKKEVILVDHNNFSQSVDGLEEADILEIVDHHNIGDIITKRPINFRNSSSGCVNTIIYELYKENDIKIPKEIAGLMASAIISDTLLLTSPTTTIKDKTALTELSKIAKISYKQYGMELLKHGMSVKGLKNEQLLYKDFKSYKVNDSLIGIGQILTSDYAYINKRLKSLVDYLDEVALRDHYRVLTLFITDIFMNKSYILYNTKSSDIILDSFKLSEVYEGVTLNNILSRKSQIAPYIMDSIEKE